MYTHILHHCFSQSAHALLSTELRNTSCDVSRLCIETCIKLITSISQRNSIHIGGIKSLITLHYFRQINKRVYFLFPCLLQTVTEVKRLCCIGYEDTQCLHNKFIFWPKLKKKKLMLTYHYLKWPFLTFSLSLPKLVAFAGANAFFLRWNSCLR